MARPTLADVARSAGVSVSTASLAFSGAGPIAEPTRERVLAAAAELDYAGPNPLGRQLRSGRSGIVGVLLGGVLGRSFREPVAVQTLDGLVSTLAELGLGVLLLPAGRGTGAPPPPTETRTDAPAAAAVPNLAATAAMDVAVLLWGANPADEDLIALSRRDVPVINVEGPAIAGNATVSINDRDGFAQLGAHLASLGHTRVAAVTLPFDRSRTSGIADAERLGQIKLDIVRRRLEGLREGGVDPVTVYEVAYSQVEQGVEAGKTLLSGPDRPTAIVAQSDALAAGVVIAARELGLDVPGDLSVTGFDGIDLPWLGETVLTTVVQPLAEKGAAVGRMVEALLAGSEPESVTFDVELRIGTTTAPPR
ncbi:MAG: substrate-binding domain-containing protein [Actinomycetales bacterium]|nr:substrate-binding domain-containing protein [Actinomycetales bacterium]